MFQLPPPPPVVVDSFSPTAADVARWRAGAIICEGDAVAPTTVPAPQPFVHYPFAREVREVRYAFTIDADGRPLDIKRVGPDYVSNGEDIAPALAVSRFAARARRGCSVTFTMVSQPVATAPLDDLLAYMAQTTTAPPSSVRARLDGIGDCAKPYPTLASRAFPDLKPLIRTPGTTAWTVTSFDIDAQGRPIDLRVLAASGNAALDRVALEAVGRSRFRAGARHGCLLPTWLGAGTLEAPPAPEEASLRPSDATCPANLPFVRPPTLTQPRAWQRRSVEGWAVVVYDVAPWGAIGNARVLAAEPSAEFGDWALAVMRGATKASATTGYVGCVDRVRFKLGDESKLLLDGMPAATPVD